MLYLVRHGQTPANASEVLQGQSDPPLSDLGRRQAEAAAPLVPPGPAVTIVSSPLSRARQTAELISGGRAVRVDARWIEIDFGVLEGQPVAAAREAMWANWAADPRWAPEGGESLASVCQRVADACRELAPQVRDEDVVIVTHVNPIKAAVMWALDVAPYAAARMFVGLGSVTTIAVGPGGTPALTTFGVTAAGSTAPSVR